MLMPCRVLLLICCCCRPARRPDPCMRNSATEHLRGRGGRRRLPIRYAPRSTQTKTPPSRVHYSQRLRVVYTAVALLAHTALYRTNPRIPLP